MTAILIKFKWNYIRNNIQSVAFLLSFILINAILFIWRLYEWSPFGWLVMLARANGQCLNFTCAFILICVLRKSITKLRSKGFTEYLPLDHHVYFHKVTGWAIVFYSIFHTAMHVINFRVLSKITTIPWFDFLFSTYLGIGWIGGAACLTGWILLLLLMAMMVPAQPFMRRSGKFEVFYYTHLLYIPFYVCLFIHAPNFWIWFLIPFVIFVIEWTLRAIKVRFGDRGLTYAEQGLILPSRVIQLIVKRPLNFDFHPGDYVYVQIPVITKYEWHPLTISSAPEQEDILWFHIRAVGEWTNRIYNYFNKEASIKGSHQLDLKWPLLTDSEDCYVFSEDSPNVFRKRSSSLGSRTSSVKFSVSNLYKTAKVMILPVPEECNEYGCGREAKEQKMTDDLEYSDHHYERPNKSSFKPLNIRSKMLKNAIVLDKPLKIRVDGPYGSPSSHIFHTQHAVLIATGIGVTPFASILQSIMMRYIEAKRSCPSCAHSWSDPIPPRVMKLRKVDFMWINRDQTSFEWFVNLLFDLERQQEALREFDRFLDIHMYITGNSGQTPPQEQSSSIPLDIRNLSPALIWHKGRPDWQKFFRDMSTKKKGRITVFYCGRNDLAQSLRLVCSRFGFQFRKEVF